MGTSRIEPNDWMINTGTGKSQPFGGANGWSIVHPNGQIEVLQCMGGVSESVVNPSKIMKVYNPANNDYSVSAGDRIRFVVDWNEPVNITGTPLIDFNEAGVPQTALYDPTNSSTTKSYFYFDVTTPGIIDNVVTTINLNGGTIISADDGVTVAILTFNSDYTQPLGVNVVA